MSDQFIRHFIALIGTLIALVIFWAGFVSGGHGWWWAFFGVLFMYIIVYKLVDAGGHH